MTPDTTMNEIPDPCWVERTAADGTTYEVEIQGPVAFSEALQAGVCDDLIQAVREVTDLVSTYALVTHCGDIEGGTLLCGSLDRVWFTLRDGNAYAVGEPFPVPVDNDDLQQRLRPYWRHLAEVHAAPEWCWPALVAHILREDATVEKVRQIVASLPDKREPKPPEWMPGAEDLVEGRSAHMTLD